MRPQSKLGFILSVGYLSIFALSELMAFYALIFQTANSALSGVLALLVTLPWSIRLVSIFNSMGYVAWYGRFAGTPGLYGLFAMLMILPAAILNAVIVYYVGKAIDGRSK